jgi:hypothetical protein
MRSPWIFESEEMVFEHEMRRPIGVWRSEIGYLREQWRIFAVIQSGNETGANELRLKR